MARAADSSSKTSKARTPRALWKGAISFGLVHIPIALYPAVREHALDFDWLDKRSMAPVGYKRINKKTGREIARDQIVKGIEVEEGEYVVLSDDEITAAYPRTTQTVEIESFVPADSIPFIYLERPYYVAPIQRGANVYALLREALKKSKRIGVARVVIQTRQHLAALIPVGPGLVLNLLRWNADIRPWQELELPADGVKAASLKERELEMAGQLIEDMSTDWDPEVYKDSFQEAILALVERKAKAGQTEKVEDIEPMEAAPESGAKILDLTELLQRSLQGGRKGKAQRKAAAPGRGTPAAKRSGAKSRARA